MRCHLRRLWNFTDRYNFTYSDLLCKVNRKTTLFYTNKSNTVYEQLISFSITTLFYHISILVEMFLHLKRSYFFWQFYSIKTIRHDVPEDENSIGMQSNKYLSNCGLFNRTI